MKSENKKIRFIDLYAGAGELSEGFIQKEFGDELRLIFGNYTKLSIIG